MITRKASKSAPVEFPKQRAVDSTLHRAIYTVLKHKGMTPADLIRTGVGRSKNTTYRLLNFESDMSMVGASKILDHFGIRLIDREGRDITSRPHHTTGDRADSRPRKPARRRAA